MVEEQSAATVDVQTAMNMTDFHESRKVKLTPVHRLRVKMKSSVSQSIEITKIDFCQKLNAVDCFGAICDTFVNLPEDERSELVHFMTAYLRTVS